MGNMRLDELDAALSMPERSNLEGSMENSVKSELLVIIGAAVAIVVTAMSIPAGAFVLYQKGHEAGQREERREIVRHGWGRYVFDERSGEADFEYGPSGEGTYTYVAK